LSLFCLAMARISGVSACTKLMPAATSSKQQQQRPACSVEQCSQELGCMPYILKQQQQQQQRHSNTPTICLVSVRTYACCKPAVLSCISSTPPCIHCCTRLLYVVYGSMPAASLLIHSP
jgi:hypothetical protein